MIHTACALLGAINYFVSVFRGTPVLPWDLTALNTALAVSSTYDFTPTGPMIIAAVAVSYTHLEVYKRQRMRCRS